ncbi:MAG: hypothetical protein R2855_12935 [Thermomicrobiales bacterium]
MSSWVFWPRSSPDRIWPGRVAVVLLALAMVWQTPVPSVAQTTCGMYAVATAPQQVGHPLSDDLVALNVAGNEIARSAFAEPRSVESSPKPGVALVRSLGGVFALMDVSTGEITPLAIPEDEQPRLMTTFGTIRNAAESNFMLLTSGPDAVWLVDLSNGDALDLNQLSEDGPDVIEAASISPDGNWLIYFFRNRGYLVSLLSPGQPQPIDPGPILAFPGFDAGNQVVYGVGEGGETSIRSLDPVSGERIDLATAPGVRIVQFRQGGPTLLVNATELMVLAPEGNEPTGVFEWRGVPSSVFVDEAGEHLLVGDEIDETTWTWVDLTTGSNVALDDLDGMSPIADSTMRDSLLFVPTVKVTQGSPGAPYRTVDLATGNTVTVLEQDSEDVYQVRPAGDDAGRFSVVNAVTPGFGRTWLVDAMRGTAELVATSTGNADARVSPDGCQLAVAVFDIVGEGRTSTVTVTSLVDGSPVATIPNALLLGWAETEPA